MRYPTTVVASTSFSTLLLLSFNISFELKLLVLAIVFVGIFCLLAHKKQKQLSIFRTILVTVVVSCLLFSVFEYNYQKIIVHENKSTHVVATVKDYPIYDSEYNNYSLELKIKTFDTKHYNGSIKTYFYDDTEIETLKPGDTLEFDTKLIKVGKSNADIAKYYKTQKLYLVATDIENLQIFDTQRINLFDSIKIVRANLIEKAKIDLPKNTAGIVTAITFGDKSELNDITYSNFKNAGVAHIMAVSGLHLTVIIMTIMSILTLVGLNDTSKRLIGIFITITVMLFAGTSPSVMRAGIMMIIYIIAFTSKGTRNDKLSSNALNSLSLAMILLMLFNPYIVTDVSFLLSCISTLAIICFAVPLIEKLSAKFDVFIPSRLLRKITMMIISSVIISVVVTFETSFITAYYFGEISILGVISNLLILPIFTPLLILSFVYFITLLFSVPNGALGTLIVFLTDKLEVVISTIASSNFAHLSLNQGQMNALALVYLALNLTLITVFIIRYKKKTKHRY